MNMLERIVEAFDFFEDWEDKYSYLAEMGQQLPPLSPAEMTPENQVHGCVSRVWILADVGTSPDPIVHLRAGSDTPIMKGIVALLVAVYSGRRAREIEALDADGIFARLGIYDHLSPNRHVGVYAMIEKIRSAVRAVPRLAA